MRNRKYALTILALALAVLFIGGCSRDPNVRKQRYLESGKKYFDQGKYREAAIQFQNAIQVDPRFAEAHYRLARSYAKLDLATGAYIEFSRAADLQPDNNQFQLELSDLLILGHQFRPALDHIETILERDPKNVDAHLLRARALAPLNKIPEAIRECETAIQFAPERPDPYVELALIQQLTPDTTAAAEGNFKSALQRDPKSAPTTILLGNFYERTHRPAEAESAYRQAIALDPKNTTARLALASHFQLAGNYDAAEDVLKGAKADFPSDSEMYRLLGDFYATRAETAKALAEYASLVQGHPKDLVVRKNYIMLLLGSQHFDDAEKLNNAILKDNPKDSEALTIRGAILIGRGNPSAAIPILEAELKNDAQNAQGHYYLGQAYSSLGQLDRAETEWGAAVKIRPTYLDAQKQLARVAGQKGDLDTVAAAATSVLAADPNSADGYTLLAAAQLGHRDVAGAEASLQKAIALAPNSPAPLSTLGQLRASQKRYAEAEALYQKALALNPSFTEAFRAWITMLAQQKQLDRALDISKTQIAKAPNNAEFSVIEAGLYVEKKDLASASAALQKAIDLDKYSPAPFLLLGQIQAQQGMLPEATATYKKAAELNPSDYRTYFLLAGLSERQGRWQEAEELYRKCLKFQPDFPAADNNLADLMLKHGENIDVALSLAQSARKALPNSPNIADTLAWAFYKKGAYASAINLLQSAIREDPQNAEYHFHLGMAFAQTKQVPQARENLNRALQLDPKSENAAEIRQTLNELNSPKG